MALLIEEIMNRELFFLRADERATDALSYLIALGISGGPVLDGDGVPVGMVSLRSLVGAPAGALVEDRMQGSVVTISPKTPIVDAARLLGETGFHRLVVVHDQRAIGIISTLDVLRGIIGMPASHPPSFPHFDEATQLTWTDDTDLSLDRVEAAPAAPGVIVLIRGGAGVRERPVWAEATHNVRSRLIDMLSLPQTESPALQYWLSRGNVRFRAAGEPDEASRLRIATKLRETVAHTDGMLLN